MYSSIRNGTHTELTHEQSIAARKRALSLHNQNNTDEFMHEHECTTVDFSWMLSIKHEEYIRIVVLSKRCVNRQKSLFRPAPMGTFFGVWRLAHTVLLVSYFRHVLTTALMLALARSRELPLVGH